MCSNVVTVLLLCTAILKILFLALSVPALVLGVESMPPIAVSFDLFSLPICSKASLKHLADCSRLNPAVPDPIKGSAADRIEGEARNCMIEFK